MMTTTPFPGPNERPLANGALFLPHSIRAILFYGPNIIFFCKSRFPTPNERVVGVQIN